MNRIQNTIFLLYLLFTLLLAQDYELVGDLNSDGVHNVQDIIQILNIILEYNDNPSEYQLWAADVNVDFGINVQDIVILVSVVLGNQCQELFYSPCSGDLSQCCPDTTTATYSWESYNVGLQGSEVWNIELFTEDNIWATGIFNIGGPEYYQGMAKWDGNEWTIHELLDSTYIWWSSIEPVIPQDIYFIEEDDYYAVSNGIYHWDGTQLNPMWVYEDVWQNQHLPVKFWGVSDDDIYLIGRLGMIVHYDGVDWSLLDSPVDNIYLRDISGSSDSEYIFITGYNQTGSVEGPENMGKSISLMYHAGVWDTLFYSDGYIGDLDNEMFGWTFNVDVLADTAYFTTTHAFVKYNYITEELVYELDDEIIWWDSGALFVHAPNDIISLHVQNGEVEHFNGVDWYIYDDLVSIGHFYSAHASNGEILVTGGSDSSGFPNFNALISIGIR